MAGAAAVLLSLALLGALPRPASGASAPASGFPLVGTLPRVGPDVMQAFKDDVAPISVHSEAGTMILLPEVRQLWQFFKSSDYSGTKIAVRNLDTMRITRTIKLNQGLLRGSTGGAGELSFAVDKGRRLFLVGDEQPNATAPGSVLTIFEFDLATFAVTLHETSPDLIAIGVFTFGGITYDRFDDSLVFLYGGVNNSANAGANTLLYRYDLESKEITQPRRVAICTGPLPSVEASRSAFAPFVANEKYLFVVCHNSQFSVTMVRIGRADAATTGSTEEAVRGPSQATGLYADPTSRRLFVATDSGELWGFDTDRMAFVGLVSAHVASTSDSSAAVGYGIDETTGQILFQSPTRGVGVVDGRFFPIPQARSAPKEAAAGQERLWRDTATNRVFVLRGVENERASDYRILDSGAAAEPAAPRNPDATTIDADEQPGVTDSQFFGSATGYGLRVLFQNGFATVPPSPTYGVQGPSLYLSPSGPNGGSYLASRCGFTDREFLAGRVGRAESSSGSTSAKAVSIDVDGNTKIDLDQPSRCDLEGSLSETPVVPGIFSTGPVGPAARSAIENADPANPRWPTSASECSSSAGGQPQVTEGKNGNPSLGSSTVTCPQPGGELIAFAETRVAGATVEVGRASTRSRVIRDAKGINTRVEATAQDIVLFGVVRIAEIRSVAESRANGRPSRTPLSSRQVVMRGVSINGEELCEACNPADVIPVLNLVLAERAEFRLGGGQDDDLARGTPAGAQTAVQKSAQRQASDQALFNDSLVELPGLEMITFNDTPNWGRARQLFQFAGAAASASYSIARIPTGLAAFDVGGVSDDGGLPFIGVLGSTAEDDDGTPRSLLRRVRDFVLAVPRAIERGIRLLVNEPREALLVLTGWVLLALPIALSRRRRLLQEVTQS